MDNASMEDWYRDLGKLFDAELFADARLICYEKNAENGENEGEGGERKRVEIPVHRAILAARSQFFADEFAKEKDKVELRELPPEVVRAMLSHLYLGDCRVEELEKELVPSLISASEFYDGFDMFEKQRVQLELVVDSFPKKLSTKYKRTVCKGFSGDWNGVPWRSEISLKMELLDEEEEREKEENDVSDAGEEEEEQGKGKKKRRRMRIDFAVVPRTDPCTQPLCVADLSLSILGSTVGKMPLHATKTEGTFYVLTDHRAEIKRENCVDHSEISEGHLQHSYVYNERAKRYIAHPQLVLRFEATYIFHKEPTRMRRIDFLRCKQREFAALLETVRFSDARIVCYEENRDGNRRGRVVVFPVHRCVLAARSEFFATAFSIGMRETETGEVEVPPPEAAGGFSMDTVLAMLLFIYTAAVPAATLDDPAALFDLFKAAHLYQIDSLMNYCIERFVLTNGNCWEFLSLADFYQSEGLKARTLRHIRANVGELSASDGWRRLMESDQHNLKMELPLTDGNCCELLALADDLGNTALKREALEFINGAFRKSGGYRRPSHWGDLEIYSSVPPPPVELSEGWRRLMASDRAELKMELPLTVENCCELLALADDLGHWRRKLDALNFLQWNKEAVKATDGWPQLRHRLENGGLRLSALTQALYQVHILGSDEALKKLLDSEEQEVSVWVNNQ